MFWRHLPRLLALFTLLVPVGPAWSQEDAAAPPLTLAEAIGKALDNNPELQTLAWDGPAASARVVQAGLRPNPELSLEVENLSLSDGGARSRSRSFGVDGSLAPAAGFERAREDGSDGFFDDVEMTLRLSQVFELGGKRAARVEAAKRGVDVATWDYEVARFELASETLTRFASVLAAQARVGEAEGLATLGGELATTVSSQVEAGRVSPLEARRANAEAERLRIAVETARADQYRACLRLAALWGAVEPGFGTVAGDLSHLPPLPELTVLRTGVTGHPLLQRWTTELARREAVWAREQKAAIPDLTVSLGYRAVGTAGSSEQGYSLGTEGFRTWRASSDMDNGWNHSLVLEASIPLPLFDRNQGAIREAEVLARKAADGQRAARVRLETALAEQHAAAAAFATRVEALEARVLPELDQTYALTREGYEAGKFDFIAVLDADRALRDARIEATEARIAYYLALAAIEGITGAALPDAPASQAPETGANDKEENS